MSVWKDIQGLQVSDGTKLASKACIWLSGRKGEPRREAGTSKPEARRRLDPLGMGIMTPRVVAVSGRVSSKDVVVRTCSGVCWVEIIAREAREDPVRCNMDTRATP